MGVLLGGSTPEGAVKVDEPLTSAEINHKKSLRLFFSIGEGFEGTASDWTEYAVWLVGVIGVFYYMANPNARRNFHAVDEEEETDDAARVRQQPEHSAEGDEIFAAPPIPEPIGHLKSS